jgi:hypothetical protein
MEQGLKEKIADVLAKVKPSLGGADIQLKDIQNGIVVVEYYRPLLNPTACHVDRTRTTKEIVTEVLEDLLRETVPGFKKVTLLGED